VTAAEATQILLYDFSYIRFFRTLTIETNGVLQGKSGIGVYRKCGYFAINPSQNSPPQICN